ncbi:type 2 lanthipeptide synthetase LanM family protein [Micromonospora sp. DSM 115977]|uniref:Type 2 lanthipeptide synthetase LanM family protein n=1 Tax=Micromonospora reichwaldensis TaxID=3075516 RepID=A0ABU2WQ39_9ACTN|nr:type 2 lanthipeptide synthetase LanM family protein [Micromonospora sp. DSM 115977]MDT0528028.1 type 2 lanthipeptide synthetase LanM family protein [Micromonospora sp. DSM 115977]
MTSTPLAGATDNACSGVRLAPHWWAPGLALHERAPGAPGRRSADAPRDADATDTAGTTCGAAGTASRGPDGMGGTGSTGSADGAGRRLARWRDGHGPGLGARLAEVGLDEAGLHDLLAEDRAALAARTTRPAWAETVEAALAAPAAPRRPAEEADWRAALTAPLRPFVEVATDRFLVGARRIATEKTVDLAALADQFTAALGRRLLAVAARTLVSELHRRRAAGRLAGADGRARFADFVAQLCDPAGLAELVDRYPVLARLLAQAGTAAARSGLELLTRFVADRDDLVGTLLGGDDPGPLVAVGSNLGDAHTGGRTTSVLRFADGRRVVYKPRDLASQVRFTGFVDWLEQRAPGLGLRGVAALTRPGYGWSEYVDATALRHPGQADGFYRRQGALVALLHALHATDMHYENLIAAGDTPVVVDTETLFHPALGEPVGTGDPAADLLTASVHRTGLIPVIVVGDQGAMDLSGVGGDRGGTAPVSALDWADPGTDRMRLTRRAVDFAGGRNRPRVGDALVDPGAHEPALREGFRQAYETIRAHRREFTELVASCADVPVRLVARPTSAYHTLLTETTHPDVLGDALERDRAFGVLWSSVAGHPFLAQFPRHEAAALWAGDVPLFEGTPGSRTVRVAGGGEPLPVPLARCGLDAALGKIAALGEADRRHQEWIVAATLATRRPVDGRHTGAPTSRPVVDAAASPERLLATACALADEIQARSVTGADRVNWLGLELVDDRQWLVLPMGAGLANGHLGVALFLGQLAAVTGTARYAELAHRAVAGVPGLFQLLDARPDLVAAIGPGGLYGLGGIAYGLARLSTLLADPGLAGQARAAVDLAAAASAGPAAVAWADGGAGCLAAMDAVHAELDHAPAAALARSWADRLVAAIERDELPAGVGFADGVAGIGWALGRHARTGGARYARAARRALRRAGTPGGDGAVGYGWCRGAAGLTLAHHALAPNGAVRLLTDRPLLDDLSLCHGELGVAEATGVLDGGAARRRAGRILDAVDRYGASCGTPGNVPTPGLLTGLAGIGYGLLRLSGAGPVPSVLLLEPTPEPRTSG